MWITLEQISTETLNVASEGYEVEVPTGNRQLNSPRV